MDVTQDGRIMCENEADHRFIQVNATPLTQEIERCTMCGLDRPAQKLQTTPESDTKPQLVWLGHYLGLDVYMDIQSVKGSKKHTDLARRLFKKVMEEHN